MKRLSLKAFGALPELLLDGEPAPAELTWRKHLALLVYLARSPGQARRREHLVGLLWPEKDEAKARHSLNEAVRAIRRAMGDDAIETRGDVVELAQGALDGDWAALEESLAAGDAEKASALWTGDFFEGFVVPGASAFDDWLESERSMWRRRVGEVLTARAERLLAGGRHADALEAAGHVLSMDPGLEAGVRTAMLAEALAGAAPAALARYDRYAAWLHSERGAVPARDLTELAERIRAGQRQPVKAAEVPPALPPLVGRASVLAELHEAMGAAAQPHATTILLTGGAGIGKSRLVREVAERARLSGRRVLRVTCVEADADQPGSVLAALLRSGLSHAMGLGGASPETLGVLAAVEPEVSRRYPGARAGPGAAAAADMGRALGEALVAIADEGPLVVAIDDAHLVDDLTLDALPAALRAAEQAPVTLLLATRVDDAVPEGLTSLRARIGHDLSGREVRLEPLEDCDVEELVAAASQAYSSEERSRLVRRLRKEAAGTPLYLVEILRALAGASEEGHVLWPAAGETTGQPLPFKVPGAVVAALALRVRALSAEARESLLAAAVAGPRVNADLVATLVDIPVREVEQRFAELERAGFLRDDGGPYHFTAEIVRATLEAEMLTGGERRRLHHRAADELARRGEQDTMEHAEHLMGAGEYQQALDAAIKVREAATERAMARLAQRAGRLEARARARLDAR